MSNDPIPNPWPKIYKEVMKQDSFNPLLFIIYWINFYTDMSFQQIDRSDVGEWDFCSLISGKRVRRTTTCFLVIAFGVAWARAQLHHEWRWIIHLSWGWVLECQYSFDGEQKEEVRFNQRDFAFRPSGRNSGTHELATALGSINGELTYPSFVLLNPQYEITFQHNAFLNAREMKVVLEQTNSN